VNRKMNTEGLQVLSQVKIQIIQIKWAWWPCSGSFCTYPSVTIDAVRTSYTTWMKCAEVPSSMNHVHSLTASGESSSISGKPFNRKSQYWLPLGWHGKTSRLNKRSSTIHAQTLMLNCCWCLNWSTPWELFSAHWWWCWRWKFMILSQLKPASSEKSTDKRKGGSAHCWTNSCHIVHCTGQSGGVRPGLAVIGMGSATAHAVLSRWPFAQHLTLSLFVTC
jgi:hypothetical protein